ncbi:50S ribosomal protein L22 [Poriferisphaera sp. WC338]|uniref:50S ribosomal protein L22 n=1 Tax=Poriferisphaera sp. WC338 TaxID=3425129 RepID=UPI003D815B57
MPYTNTHRGARISPTKARLVADLIRGKSVDDALVTLMMSKKRAAVFMKNALNAAVANADQAEANTRSLRVSEARVDEGPTMKRFQPKDRGRAHPIMKRTCHITISVDEA